MAIKVLTNAGVKVNSVDLTDHVREVRINFGAEAVDRSTMGSAWKQRVAGVKDWSVEVVFAQDYAATEVDITLFSLVGAAAFDIDVIEDKDTAISTTNPLYEGTVILETYPPLGGGHGELHETAVTFQGTGELARTISGSW